MNEIRAGGKIVSVTGLVVRVLGVRARIGDLCRFHGGGLAQPLLGQVVGLDDGHVILLPLGNLEGLSFTTVVENLGSRLSIPTAQALLGRVVDGFCRPLDGAPIMSPAARGTTPVITSPLQRPIISDCFHTGIRAIDGLLTLGVGQRVGIFAGPGVGKTTLLSAIANHAQVDAVVLALIGERGREVNEFIRDGLAEDMRSRSVVVVATSDRPAGERVKAAEVACSIAEALRSEGRNVLLVVDSLTRYCRALREVASAAGEPPARRGFPPSVFAALPQLIERAGSDGLGSITALYTVLVEGAIGSDPVSEEAMSLLDGHIILSPELAAAAHYPAIDVLSSRSRVARNVCAPQQLDDAAHVRRLMAAYRKSELLVRLGEYQAGHDAELDEAVAKQEAISAFLRQSLQHPCLAADMLLGLRTLAARAPTVPQLP